jgi:hypothetical protein
MIILEKACATNPVIPNSKYFTCNAPLPKDIAHEVSRRKYSMGALPDESPVSFVPLPIAVTLQYNSTPKFLF